MEDHYFYKAMNSPVLDSDPSREASHAPFEPILTPTLLRLHLRELLARRNSLPVDDVLMTVVCGGEGSRLRFFSRLLVKPVLLIKNGMTLPHSLADDGLKYFPEVYFSTVDHYRHLMLQSIQPVRNERRRVILEHKPLGTGYAIYLLLQAALDQGYEYIAVLYADNFLKDNCLVLEAMVKARKEFEDLPSEIFNVIFTFDLESEKDPTKGWIQLGEALPGHDYYRVTEFLEKPSLTELRKRQKVLINPAIHLVHVTRALEVLKQLYQDRIDQEISFGWEDLVLRENPTGLAAKVLRFDEKIWADIGDVQSWCRTFGKKQGDGNWTTGTDDNVYGSNCFVLNDSDFWRFEIHGDSITAIISLREDSSWIVSIFDNEYPPIQDIRKQLGRSILENGAQLYQEVEFMKFLVTTNVLVKVDPDSLTISVSQLK